MGGVQEVQLQIRGISGPPSGSPKDTEAAGDDRPQPRSKLKHWRWWVAVAANVFFILAGQTVATLLGRLYYNEGGNSMWMATLVQSAGAPLLIPFLLLPPSQSDSSSSSAAAPPVPRAAVASTYVALGLLIAGDNLMYSYGLLYLPVSTYSLICSTQLAFSVAFAYLLNAQRLTALILNSVVLLVFAAALLGVSSGSDGSSDVPKGKYPLGFALTLGASATFSLILSLMQRAFQRVVRRETFAVVVEMQMWTNAAAACASVAGLFASGEWRGLAGEMEGYGKGRAAYVMTLLWTAVAWQVSSVGTVGLIFLVSSLFSNVISTLALPVVPVFAVVFFRDRMDGVKVVAMLIAVWGFLSYIYQHYIDDSKAERPSDRDEPIVENTDTS
ncbi:hypothetical protein M6B38_167365 [Iris pallida]|uniref:Probable purine permease n=1 Tax=Iris pallida TaxID=29817 RepID=A0AAX6EWV6_IRIPA|nr:hypothetical protein M6B38_167365 [Iris pallida]